MAPSGTNICHFDRNQTTMPAPQCLLIARDDDDWTGPVLADASELLPTAIAHPDASSIDTSAVRVLVGGPPDLAHWVTRCPSLQWIQSTWAGVDALTRHLDTDVKISPLRGVYGQAMSEFTMGWILSIHRNILTRATAQRGNQSSNPDSTRKQSASWAPAPSANQWPRRPRLLI